ncbi:ketopantoate reductase family protein [Bradyrhizobium erythrophlei]|uniref:ketopantoate reductase family protein n=1 Tax=Bradyrhizobium erythrophlei TaxID=1437360 RepID=UPI000932F4DD|nr:2-dehydropantoate 2-reductase N-terminal domain-containing protein [Bradyrhizobium erythrophlei]
MGFAELNARRIPLTLAGHEVSVVACGEHLKAIRARGLTLRIGGIEKRAAVQASDDPAQFGPQDYVFCTLKSHQAYAAARSFVPLLGPKPAFPDSVLGRSRTHRRGESLH